MMKLIYTKFLLFCLCTLLSMSCGTPKENVLSQQSTELNSTQDAKLSIFEKLKENDHISVEDRIALYRKLKSENPDGYNFEDEQELNRYGYFLMSKHKNQEAIEIFQLLVSEFPNSFNPYDSLGEAYLSIGNEELALKNYEKSVELNAKNTGAIDAITKLKGLELLVTDWGKEIFHFPLHFAPEIPYEGVEEVVFPKNWIKEDSTDFWSYVFVWALDNKQMVSTKELEANLQLYFDGLMGVVNDDDGGEMIRTNVQFETNKNTEDSVDFTGSLTIFDAFATKKPLNLKARIYSNYCEERKKLILLFRFSPLDYEHPIWDKLRTVEVRANVCAE